MGEDMIQVGLLWHTYTNGNLGVSALTAANLSIIHEQFVSSGIDVKYVILGPKGDAAFTEPQNLPTTEYVELSSSVFKPNNIFVALNRIYSCDYIFDIGGGDSFSDIYGWKRFLKICLSKTLFDPFGKKLILSPQTIGPFKSPIAQALAKFTLKRAKACFARDIPSFEYANSLVGIANKKKIKVVTDVAFSLPAYDKWPENFPSIDTSKVNVGINISGLLYAGGYDKDNQFGLTVDYKELIDLLLNEFINRDNCQVWLVPHVYKLTGSIMEDDKKISEYIASRNEKIKVSPVFLNGVEAKTFIKKMDFFTGARMHATIAAVSTGVACVPLAYSKKFSGVFGTLNYPYTIDLRSGAADTLVSEILTCFENRDELKQCAIEAKISSDELLNPYREYIKELINCSL
jgi:colanic acid/amylovoran biosynthesis protein